MSYRYFWLSALLLTLFIKESRSDCLTVPWDSLRQDSYSEVFLGRLDHKRKVNHEIHFTFDVLHKWKGSASKSVTLISTFYPPNFMEDSIYLVTADRTRYKGNQRMNKTFLETSTCTHILSIYHPRFSNAVVALDRLFPDKVELPRNRLHTVFEFYIIIASLLGVSIYLAIESFQA